MDNKFYISLEAARLLKEKGYRQTYHAYYFGNSNLRKGGYRGNSWYDSPDFYPAPTKAEAIDWLESNGIGISIIFCEIEMYEYVVELKDCYYNVVESGYKETRLEAEEAAIIGALKLL